ncbi:MAG: hypothetical protein IJ620_01825, partial [Bacteroidales bacterium]|nr:hypothetical protein [Bacteroidales bacterium]
MTFQFVIILVVMIVMWLGAFIHPVQMPVMQSGFIYQFFYNIFHGVPLLASIVAFLIIGVEGFWLNAILYNCRLVPQNTLLPMLLYVVAMSSQPDTQTITPM